MLCRKCARGLYSGGHFFGILDEGRLFFKTDAQSQMDDTARGMGPFTHASKGKVMTMACHEAPPEVLEQPQELVGWARKAIGIAAGFKKPANRAERDCDSVKSGQPVHPVNPARE